MDAKFSKARVLIIEPNLDTLYSCFDDVRHRDIKNLLNMVGPTIAKINTNYSHESFCYRSIIDHSIRINRPDLTLPSVDGIDQLSIDWFGNTLRMVMKESASTMSHFWSGLLSQPTSISLTLYETCSGEKKLFFSHLSRVCTLNL